MNLNYLTLKRLLRLGDVSILTEQLAGLACPYTFRIGYKEYPVPITVNDFKKNICWGQRLMMNTPHESDLESMMFFVANYYQPIVTKKPYSEKDVVKFYKRITTCHVHELYPVLNRLVTLFIELTEIEARHLDSRVTAEMRAAEIDRLKPFNDLEILKLISRECKVDLDKAHQQPYNVVFALLWYEKESADFNNRLQEILMSKTA